MSTMDEVKRQRITDGQMATAGRAAIKEILDDNPGPHDPGEFVDEVMTRADTTRSMAVYVVNEAIAAYEITRSWDGLIRPYTKRKHR